MVRFAPHVARALVLREATSAYGASTAPAREPARVPDPFTDADALEELEEEIVTLAAHESALVYRQLVLIAEFDRRRGFELGGHRSCAHWLGFVTGLDLGTAREKVRAARALAGLPETSAAMERGELSFSKVRALTRVATAENEGELLQLATGCPASVLERVVRGWKVGSRQSETERERVRHESRELSVFPGEDGLYEIRGRLTPEIGALLMRAIEAASDALYRERGERGKRGKQEGDDVSAETSLRVAAQRRADALGLLAERALAAGFGDGAPLSGTRPERYQVMLHVDRDTLADGGEPDLSELEDGTRVSAETSRRLACDAAIVPVIHDAEGRVLDVGRKTRSIPPALRRALEARDRGCRFPGCGLRFTDGHHIRHWADGGRTVLDNLILLCPHHHRLVHERGWTVEWWGKDRTPAFLDPRGQAHVSFRSRDGAATKPSPRALPPDPVAALVVEHRERGIEPDTRPGARSLRPRWKREADIPDSVWFAALEAMG